MSLSDELRRNREVFRRLESGGTVDAQETIPAGESGGAGDAAFLQSLRQGGGQFQNAVRVLEGQYGFRQAQQEPLAGGQFRQAQTEVLEAIPFRQGEARAEPVRIPSVAPVEETGVEIKAVEYPAIAASPGAENGGELLDSLLRRIEAQGRLYPQETGTEGDGGWQI